MNHHVNPKVFKRKTWFTAENLQQEHQRAGVGAIFTLSGGHIMPIYDGALDEEIIDVRHEQAAVHAADAYRLNPGRIGCAVLTAARE